MSLFVPGSVVQGQTSNVNVFVVVSPTTYQLDLKAIEGEIPTRNFVIKPQSVVQVNQGNNIVVATQPITQIVESVKVQDLTGAIKDLESLGNNVYSLAGFPPGAYILDVIVDLGSGKKGAYETILVILAEGQQPVNPTQIINRFKTIIIDNGNETKPDPDPPCPDGYELVEGKCVPMPCPEDSQLDTKGKCIPLPDPICDPASPECPPTQCPDGRIMPPGKPCPDDAVPCDDPNAPEGCSVPTECPDGTIIPPGEQCPDVDYGDEGEDSSSGNGDSGDNDNADSGDSGDSGNGDDSSGDNSGGDVFEPDNQGSGSGGAFD
jgi:hypothetical protein